MSSTLSPPHDIPGYINNASVTPTFIINFLPNEILAIILEFTISAGTSVVDVSQPPWTLSHVCRQWRDISLSAGVLWSNITMDISECSSSPFTGQMQILEMFLSRSHNRGLYVRIGGDSDSDISEFALWRILQRSSRICHLEVNLHLDDFVLFNHLEHPFPSLKNLVVEHTSSPGHGIPHVAFGQFLKLAPQLRKVVFGDGFGSDAHLIVNRRLPAAQLVDIEIHGNTDPCEPCLSILKSCPQLRNLCLPRATSDCEKKTFPAPLRHDYLTSLTILCDFTIPTEDDVSSVFDFITLPSLSSLTFKSNWTSNVLAFVGALAPFTIQSFITRSSCTIRHLRIDSTITNMDLSYGFLFIVPSLEIFEYRPSDPMGLPTPFFESLGEHFVQRLYYDSDDETTPVLLPNLKTLIMEDCHGFFEDSFFPFMIESRYRFRKTAKVANLEKVSFMVEDDLVADGMEALDACMCRGLDVWIGKRIWEDEKLGIVAKDLNKSMLHSIVQIVPSLE